MAGGANAPPANSASSHLTRMESHQVTIADAAQRSSQQPVVICDVSPPRGNRLGPLVDAVALDADFLSVAYSPGQSVRVNPVVTGAQLAAGHGKQVVISLATRDMNRIAMQSLLLGASWLGLHNVVVLRGDPMLERVSRTVSPVNDYTTTALLSDIVRMNDGYDFRGLPLDGQTSFCPGATADIGRGLHNEAALAAKKTVAGAEFLLCQPAFNTSRFGEFTVRLADIVGDRQAPALFAGVQILVERGVEFGNVPKQTSQELAAGRPGLDIAMEESSELWDLGVRTFYVVPPILRGGVRDYTKANQLIRYLNSLAHS